MAQGGQATHIQSVAEMAAHNHGVTDPGHSHTFTADLSTTGNVLNGNGCCQPTNGNSTTGTSTTGITINSNGSSAPFNVMGPFVLGTWFVKL